MSLSGNLGFVSLDEVLRLLNRSNQRGVVEVQGEATSGRIFFDRGVTLATTYSDEELAALITRSGMTEGAAMSALLREMAVESLYQLSAHGTRFEVVEQRTAPVTAGTAFELEELLADARRRFDEWAEVTSVITDLDTLIKLRRDLGDRDRITIDRDSWRLITEVGHGSTVRKLARELGTTEFWAAKVAAGMIDESLLQVESVSATEPADEWAEPEWSESASAFAEAPAEVPAVDETVEPADDEPAAAFAEDHGQTVETSAETETSNVDPGQSWWQEPARDEAPAASTGEDGGVEEDTEAFLEKVFSGLGTDDQPQEEEGYGLLRRRRLGALRDLSNDS